MATDDDDEDGWMYVCIYLYIYINVSVAICGSSHKREHICPFSECALQK